MRATRVAVLILVGALLLVTPAAAQRFENVPEAKPADQAPAPAGIKIGVINIQLAMANTQEGKKASEDLRAQFSPRQAEMEKVQRESRDLDNQLRPQERTLSDDARAQIARQMEQRRKLVTRMDQDLRDDIQDAQEELVNRIGGKMQQIIDRYAQDKGLNLILNIFQGGPVIFATAAVDITEDIVRLYDQAYPVQAAAPPPPPPAPRPAPAPPRAPPPPPPLPPRPPRGGFFLSLPRAP